MPRVLSKPKLILSPIVLALGCVFSFLTKDVGQTLLILIILVAIIFIQELG